MRLPRHRKWKRVPALIRAEEFALPCGLRAVLIRSIKPLTGALFVLAPGNRDSKLIDSTQPSATTRDEAMMQYAIQTFVMVLSLLLAGTAQARGELAVLKQTSPQLRANLQTAFMKRKLHLTPQQEPKVAALNLRYAKRIDPILKGNAGEIRKAMAIRRIQNEKDAALGRMLTQKQYRIYLASKNELRRKLMDKLRSR